MDEQRKQELADIIGSLESRHKHYAQVAERHNAEEMTRAFTSAFNDFEYAIQILRAIRDERGFDMEDEDE
ncbi:MAG TPA: hypothetical protein VFZ34_12835 [Blastocatellia bacterium]|nr:hypothetical protein [Blastocatellia bacterium]